MRSAIVTAVACLAVAACTGRPHLFAPAAVDPAPYQGWSCDRLSREAVRTDAAFTAGEKKTIEQVMIARSCIHPLAAETE